LIDGASNSVFAIRSRSGTTVIAELQNNYRKPSGGNYQCITAFDTASGIMYAANCRLYTPNYPVLVDLTSGSTTLANAGRDDSYGGFLQGSIAVDDRVFVMPYRDLFVPEDKCKIATRTNGSPGSIVMETGGTATRTLARKRLQFLIRKPPSNASSR
jgi:hypothetical protein